MLDHYDSIRTTGSDLLSIAQRAEYLNRLPADQLRRLIAAGTVKEFPGHSVVAKEGSPRDEVYLILRGSATVSLYGAEDPAFWLYVSGQGSMVDMCALLDPPVSPLTILALSDLEVLAIPRAEFAQVMQEEPAVGYEVLQDLCARMSMINKVVLKEYRQQSSGPSLN